MFAGGCGYTKNIYYHSKRTEYGIRNDGAATPRDPSASHAAGESRLIIRLPCL
jgi:hypothetical protein